MEINSDEQLTRKTEESNQALPIFGETIKSTSPSSNMSGFVNFINSSNSNQLDFNNKMSENQPLSSSIKNDSTSKKKKNRKNFINIVDVESKNKNENINEYQNTSSQNENQSKNLNDLDYSANTSSGVIHIPNTSLMEIINDDRKNSSYVNNNNPFNNLNDTNSNNNLNKNKVIFIQNFPHSTLNEPISTTIYRDIYLIYTKLKLVINPFISQETRSNQIKQWDLWGPLIFDMILGCTLSIHSDNKSKTIVLIFVIFWLGGLFVYLNSYFLGVKCSLFQLLCLLGYCLFPLNIAAFILCIINFGKIFGVILAGFAGFWSIYSASSFLKGLTFGDKRYLVLYPCILFYLYISYFVFAVGHK